MSNTPIPLFVDADSVNRFCSKFSISDSDFKKAMYTSEQLNCIYLDFLGKKDILAKKLDKIESCLKKCDKVHSTSARPKDPEHLIEKIIRKTNETNKRYTLENYFIEITDLMGVRLLYVFKEDFPKIHNFIQSQFSNCIKEKIACIRKGDKTEIYKDTDLKIETRNGYRSVHYIIDTGDYLCCEIQVRTLTEEAWGEIDHSIRYPYNKNNQKLSIFDDIMSNLTGTLDDLSSFAYNYLIDVKSKENEKRTFNEVFIEFLKKTKVK